jgi:hypothetical protein
VPPAKRKAAEPGAPKLRRGGRNGSQPVYTQALADEICDRLADGEPLNVICKTPGMPCFKAVLNWVRDEKRAPGFGQSYARARSVGYERIADEVLAISDTDCLGPNGYVDNAAVQRARLMVESRKWMLSKMLPKIYGDKIELSGDANAPLLTRIELVAIRPKQVTIDHDDE